MTINFVWEIEVKVKQAYGAERFVVVLFFFSSIFNIFLILSEAYWEPFQVTRMGRFAKHKFRQTQILSEKLPLKI